MPRIFLTSLIVGFTACAHPNPADPAEQTKAAISGSGSGSCPDQPAGSQLTRLLLFSIGNGISIVTLGTPVLVLHPVSKCDRQ